ncbi:hypothetical protein DW322_05540 [Rhodococcus rhodnii]|uniref:Asp23/Gls24 family envelope stress response protein n=1 Tax=Rhodococcus rhodnii TaxID=38312 RepID=A0A6P2CAZ6_9NOCA|nr:hypothetical protein [Rhodococcus rhodnii]TXG89773.1 hypothetical protein DW322_05540 [Rhodococcus rhodnii]
MDDTADRVAAAVLAVGSVAALHGGKFGEVATYLPGRRVEGVRLSYPGAQVHVTAYPDGPLHDVAEQIRAAVAPLVGEPVDVTIEDVVARGPLLSP